MRNEAWEPYLNHCSLYKSMGSNIYLLEIYLKDNTKIFFIGENQKTFLPILSIPRQNTYKSYGPKIDSLERISYLDEDYFRCSYKVDLRGGIDTFIQSLFPDKEGIYDISFNKKEMKKLLPKEAIILLQEIYQELVILKNTEHNSWLYNKEYSSNKVNLSILFLEYKKSFLKLFERKEHIEDSSQKTDLFYQHLNQFKTYVRPCEAGAFYNKWGIF